MKECILEIKDEVNVRLVGLDPDTRRKLVNKVKFFLPHARHTPTFKLGRWDGTMSFCDTGGRTYLNLLDRLLPIIQDAGYKITIEDNREEHSFEFEPVTQESYSHITWPAGHPNAGHSVILRDYQAEIINSYLSTIQGINICPTAGGKTIITAILSHKVEKYGRSVVIVPTKDLVVQTEADYKNFGLDVGVYFGDRKEWNKTHTICTWQSLEVMFKLKDDTLSNFIDGVVCVMVDEVHKAKADVLRKLLSGTFAHVPIRWGLTGTLPELDHEKVSVLSCIGEIISTIKAKDLQDKGYLSNLHINIRQLVDYDNAFSNYQSELAWLMSNKERLDCIARMISDIVATGNTLVLVDRVKTGKILNEAIEGSIFLHGGVKSADRKEAYQEIQFTNDNPLIATFGIASTGISINRIFNLVLLESGKGFVRVIQSIGRGLRVAEDKDFVNVYDLCSTCKYSKRHLAKRKKFYSDAEYPYTIEKVKY